MRHILILIIQYEIKYDVVLVFFPYCELVRRYTSSVSVLTKFFKDRLVSCSEFKSLKNLKEVYFKECFQLLLRIPKSRNPFFLEALILRHSVLKTLRIFIYLYSVFCVECIRMYWFIITE